MPRHISSASVSPASRCSFAYPNVKAIEFETVDDIYDKNSKALLIGVELDSQRYVSSFARTY